MTTVDNDKFWLKDPGILFRNNNFYQILPTGPTLNQKLNALTRLFIYITIICFIVRGLRPYKYIPLIILILIIVMHYLLKDNNPLPDNLDWNSQNTYHPRPDNNNDNYPNYNIMNNVENDYIANDGIDDTLYGRNAMARAFYTVASNEPNDQEAFAKWLYQIPETCKENPAQCFNYEDVRFIKPN